jgi:hypothetical protein
MTDTDSIELDRLAEAIRDRVQALGGVAPPEDLHLVVLAQFFRYNVEQGGFAQLLYNLQGSYLEDIERMLVASSAPVAQEYYVRALRAALANVAAYRDFLDGNYVDPHEVKDSLHAISFEYFEQRVDFVSEASQFIAAGRDVVQRWGDAGG